jgi:hypothetical protein
MVQLTERFPHQTIAEIFKEIKAAKNRKDRIELMQKQKNNQAFLSILRLQFDSRFKFALPPGKPSGLAENKIEPGMGQLGLEQYYKKLYLFLEGTTNIKQYKRESMFLSVLEALDKEEAELLVAVKDKKLDSGITKKLVEEVFPNLLPHETTKTL